MDQQLAWQETLSYLFDKLPMFSNLGKSAIRKDLTNIRKLCKALNEPQQHFKSIHIAGTNGKGSTSHMLAAVLQKAGYKVGLYTSPHLSDFRERIRINGAPVSKEWVIDFVQSRRSLIESIEPSFFEITVAMAFKAFKDFEADIAVVETGLGGRLDSTNIIDPILSVITNISFDHKDVLGNSLKEIAREKAGIIKQDRPVLIGEYQEETWEVFLEISSEKQAPLYKADGFWDLIKMSRNTDYRFYEAIHKTTPGRFELKTDLQGAYQQYNIKTVLAATEILTAAGIPDIPLETVIKALSEVKRLTGLRGRWECLGKKPLVIADVAHNPAGIKEVMEQWKQVNARRKHIVAGFVKDKDVEEVLSFFPKDAVYHFCNAGVPRAMPVSDLAVLALKAGLEGSTYPRVSEAVKGALESMNPEDALLITGSFFVVGEILGETGSDG